MRRSLLGLLTLLAVMMLCGAAFPRSCAAQAAVAGTVRDSASQQPLSGAVVLLLDSTGATLGRGTTDQRGRYRVTATADARRLRVLRLGFRPQQRALPASDATIDVALVAIPMLLEQVRVTASASCPKRADRAAAFALLEQVRAGLLATVIARAENRARMTMLLYERRFDGGGDRIAWQGVRRRVGSGMDRAFGAARDGAAFVRDGFREDSSNTFFGPEAETLIDDAFADGYCFQVAAPDRARPHQIGLGFGPAERRTGRVDIAGTLWVDTAARTLRDLDFRYLGLERATTSYRPGGRLSFNVLPNGATVVDRWSLRLVGGRSTRLDVTEIGGELARAAWPDGAAWTAPLGAVRLEVVGRDGVSAARTPVRLDGTDYEGVTDLRGILTLGDLLPGPYSASVVDPRLASLGLTLATPLRFVAVRDSTVAVRVDVQSAEELTARRCLADRSSGADTTGGAWLLGRVTTPDGRPVADARWSIRPRDGDALVEGGRTGGDGLLHWCRLQRGRTVIVEAASRDGRRASETRYLGERLTTVRLTLPP